MNGGERMCEKEIWWMGGRCKNLKVNGARTLSVPSAALPNSQLGRSCCAHKQTARVSTVGKIFSSLSRIKLDNRNVNLFPKGLLLGSSSGTTPSTEGQQHLCWTPYALALASRSFFETCFRIHSRCKCP